MFNPFAPQNKNKQNKVNEPDNNANAFHNIIPRNNQNQNQNQMNALPKNNQNQNQVNALPKNNQNQNQNQNQMINNALPKNNRNQNQMMNNALPKNNQNQNQNQMMNNALPKNNIIEKNVLPIEPQYIKGNYSDKHHYFIGSIIHRNDVRQLVSIQKLLKNPLFQNLRWSVPFHTRYIYLGYIDSSVATEMMNRIFHPLCLAIAEKYSKFTCKYEKIKYRSKPPKDRGVKIISAQYKDEGNLIYKVIIPYLKKEGLKKVYDVEMKMEKPHIDLLYGNCDDATYRQIAASSPTFNFSNNPNNPKRIKSFEIDHLCLIKGTSYVRKFGIPSKYDRLNIETVKEFYYPLRTGNTN